MAIDIQLNSIIVSLCYGFVFSFLLKINYKYIYCSTKVLKILINVLFVIDNVLIYFIILKKINGGVVHSTFLLMILTGFAIAEIFFKRFTFDFKIKK